MKARHAKEVLATLLRGHPTVVPPGSLLLIKLEHEPDAEQCRRLGAFCASTGCKIPIVILSRDAEAEVVVGDPSAL